MRFSELANWLVGKTIANVDHVEAPTVDGAVMVVDEVQFTDGSSISLGGKGLLAIVEDITLEDGRTVIPWPDPDPELDPLRIPASRVIEDLPLDAPIDRK